MHPVVVRSPPPEGGEGGGEKAFSLRSKTLLALGLLAVHARRPSTSVRCKPWHHRLQRSLQSDSSSPARTREDRRTGAQGSTSRRRAIPATRCSTRSPPTRTTTSCRRSPPGQRSRRWFAITPVRKYLYVLTRMDRHALSRQVHRRRRLLRLRRISASQRRSGRRRTIRSISASTCMT